MTADVNWDPATCLNAGEVEAGRGSPVPLMSVFSIVVQQGAEQPFVKYQWQQSTTIAEPPLHAYC